MHLSQAHLNLLTSCPRKFQQTYLEQLGSPTSPEQQERLTQGSQFHLLLQQWQLGLPVEPLLAANPPLQKWFRAFEAKAPEILAIEGEPSPITASEHSRTLECQGFLLTVIYDLLILGQGQAKILDWKTYPRPQRAGHLLDNWQTRLYLFVLAETTAYAAENLSMTYWFFQAGAEDGAELQSLVIPYSAQRHAQTGQELQHLLSQLTHWLAAYQQGQPLPLTPLSLEECDRCSYTTRCYGSQTPKPTAEAEPAFALPNLAEIAEVPL